MSEKNQVLRPKFLKKNQKALKPYEKNQKAQKCPKKQEFQNFSKKKKNQEALKPLEKK